MDVFQANFRRLAADAYEIAFARAEMFTARVIEGLASKGTIDAASDPDFQYALFSAQRDYARAGDETLGEALVDLLTDRAAERDRNLRQIVLNEAIITAPKLTPVQYTVLSVIFTILHTRSTELKDLDDLETHVRERVGVFGDELSTNRSDYQHIEYVGCGSISSVGSITIERTFQDSYMGLFIIGFKPEALEAVDAAFPPQLVVPCLHNPERLQLAAMDEVTFRSQCEQESVHLDVVDALWNLQRNHQMSQDQVKAYLASLDPGMEALMHRWDESPAKEHLTNECRDRNRARQPS
jgi:hypothetical protein